MELHALIDKFNKLNGLEVYIIILHALYGAQKLRCVLQTLWDGERIGFIVDGEDKYIMVKELQEMDVGGNMCHLKSDVMEVYINKVN